MRYLAIIGVLATLLLAACGSGGDTASPEASPAAGPAASATGLLEIIAWDDTDRRPPGARAEIWLRGTGSWFPDLASGADREAFGRFPRGAAAEFFVYPDGRDGREIQVLFRIPDDQIPGSDRDVTHVEIHDTEVVVRGTAIPDFEQRFRR